MTAAPVAESSPKDSLDDAAPAERTATVCTRRNRKSRLSGTSYNSYNRSDIIPNLRVSGAVRILTDANLLLDWDANRAVLANMIII